MLNQPEQCNLAKNREYFSNSTSPYLQKGKQSTSIMNRTSSGELSSFPLLDLITDGESFSHNRTLKFYACFAVALFFGTNGMYVYLHKNLQHNLEHVHIKQNKKRKQ